MIKSIESYSTSFLTLHKVDLINREEFRSIKKRLRFIIFNWQCVASRLKKTEVNQVCIISFSQSSSIISWRTLILQFSLIDCERKVLRPIFYVWEFVEPSNLTKSFTLASGVSLFRLITFHYNSATSICFNMHEVNSNLPPQCHRSLNINYIIETINKKEKLCKFTCALI